jgi:hypothetical protein
MPRAEIDHEAERELGDRIDEARARARDQDAGRRGGADVDVPDVDRAAHEGDQVRQPLEHRRGTLRRAVGDDHLRALRALDQLLGRERVAGLVQAHLAELPQPDQRLVAVVVGARLGRVGQENGRHDASPALHLDCPQPRPIVCARLPCASLSPAGSGERATRSQRLAGIPVRENLWLRQEASGVPAPVQATGARPTKQ